MLRYLRGRIGFALAVIALVSGTSLMLNAEPPQAVGTWASIGASPEGRVGAASVALPDGRTVITGGLSGGVPTDAVVVFDPEAGSFTTVGQLTAPRTGHTATLLEDGRIVIAGGTVNELLTADVEIYDLSTATAALAATMTELRSGHAAARLPNGSVLIAGGSGTDGVLQTAEIFDPATGMSALTSPLLTARTNASATSLIDGRILIAGGSNGADLRSAEIFDPASQSFQPTDTDLSIPRSGHTAVLLPHNNSVLIAGGSSDGMPLATVDLFVPAEFPDPFSYGMGRFAPTGEMAAPRSGAAGGPHVEGYAYVTGGGAADAEVYRFATIKTDKDDYEPGELAVITGSGWEPNEEVTLLFQEDPAVHADYTFTVTADSEGNIHHDQWAPEEHDLGVRFYLMAVGTRSRAQTTFTDNRTVTKVELLDPATSTYVIAPAQITTAGGASFTVRVTATTDATGGGPSGTPDDWESTSWEVLSGADIVESGCDSGINITSATVGATHVFSATAPEDDGTYSVRVRAWRMDGCGANPSTAVTYSNGLVVAATNVATTVSINAPAITYGQNGSVTVTVNPNSGSDTPTGDVSLSVDGETPVTRTLSGGSYIFTAADVPELATPSAGNHSLSASYAGATGFDASGPTAGTLTVNQKSVEVTASSHGVTYGDPAPTITPSYDGFVLGEDEEVLTTAATCTTTYDQGDPVSGSPYPTSCSGAAADNYTFTYVDGEVVVSQKSVEVTASSHGVTYGDPAPTITPSYDGFVLGQTAAVLTTAPTCTTTYDQGDPVSGSPYPTSCSGAVADNYTFTYVDGEIVVEKAVLTVTAKSASRPFGTPNPDLSAPLSITGFVLGEGPSVITGLTCGTTATAASPVGEHAVTCSGGIAANYDFEYIPGTLTITAWHLTGFYQPVGVPNSVHTAPGASLPNPTALTVWNTIKGGQTVPLKFEIFETMGGTERTSVADVQQPFLLTPFSCMSGSAMDDVDFTTTGSTSLRYDGLEGQFIQNWKTPTGANKCYRATMKALDGSAISAFFRTK